MRVIAGTAKGTPLQPVPGTGTRPISDRVKEALFSILETDVKGATVLDLFAGTGSVGIEALSRGAEQAVFVEKHPKAVATIRANLQRAGLDSIGRVVKSDVFRFLRAEPQPFDLVYIAPPQYLGLWKQTLLALDDRPAWFGASATVIVQIFPKEWEDLALSNLEFADRRQYGSTLLLFYQLYDAPLKT